MTHHRLLISYGRTLELFQLGALRNTGAMGILAHVFYTYMYHVSVSYTPKNGVTGLQSMQVFGFWLSFTKWCSTALPATEYENSNPIQQ
jgi:hypothetical protein